MPVRFFLFDESEFFVEVFQALFGDAAATENFFGGDAEIESDIGARNECGKRCEIFLRRRHFVEAEVFEVYNGVIEVSVRENKLDATLFEFFQKESEADDIDEDEYFPEQERKKRDLRDGGFFSWHESFFAFEASADLVCQRKLNCMKRGNSPPVSFEALFEKNELR